MTKPKPESRERTGLEIASDECGSDRRQHRRATVRLCGLKQTGEQHGGTAWRLEGQRGEQHGDWKGGGRNGLEGLQRSRRQQASQNPTGLRYCPVTGKGELYGRFRKGGGLECWHSPL